MLDRRSALASAKPYASPVLQIGEAREFSLLQVAGSSKALTPVTGKLPGKVGVALQSAGRTLMRTGENQFWIVGPESDDIAMKLNDLAILTPLSHSRTRIFIEGAPARDVLSKSIPLDFHTSVFKPGMFAMTGIHHTPVLVHCSNESRFEIYALRTFAMSVYDWLTDAALEFAD
jgi:heterotetrameric sarcosine oxidase gamma subunit